MSDSAEPGRARRVTVPLPLPLEAFVAVLNHYAVHYPEGAVMTDPPTGDVAVLELRGEERDVPSYSTLVEWWEEQGSPDLG